MKPSLEKKLGKVTYNEQVIELASSESTTEEWQPNPTWWDIEKILAEDTRDYEYKAILLLCGSDVAEDTLDFNGLAYATSDGAFYELETAGSVEHTWDLTKDKPCLVDGVELYKTRYVIVYGNDSLLLKQQNNVIFVCVNKFKEGFSGYFHNNYAMQSISCLDKDSVVQGTTMFDGCRSLQSIPQLNVGVGVGTMFQQCYSLRTVPLFDTSQMTNFSSMFNYCQTLKSVPQLDTSKGTNFSSMFQYCRSLQTIPQLDTSKGTNFSNMFAFCDALITIPLIDTSNGTGFGRMFQGCYSLQTTPQLDTSKGNIFEMMFSDCSSLQTIPQLDTSKGTNFSNMFQGCYSLQTTPPLNTGNGQNFQQMFSGCSRIKTIEKIDLIKATTLAGMFNSCKALQNLTLKNIKKSLQIGSGTTYGHLLTLESLLNTIKELHDNTSGTSTLTLTVGSANLTKLANVYVKLVDITDEMRAEDEYIDNKKPFEVCESTDEGAMLITEYVTSKNWQLA